jgi:amino acid transporter
MANDNLLPVKLCALHPRFGTPYVSIILSSCVVSVLIFFTFSDLVIMDIMLYGAGLFLEFITLILLRAREPLRPRPFRIPLGYTGLVLLMLMPISVYLIALSGVIYSQGTALLPVYIALGMLASSEPIWRIIVWINPGVASILPSGSRVEDV